MVQFHWYREHECAKLMDGFGGQNSIYLWWVGVRTWEEHKGISELMKMLYVLTLAVVTWGYPSIKIKLYINDVFTFLYETDTSIFKKYQTLERN